LIGTVIILMAGLAVLFIGHLGERLPVQINIAAGGSDGAYQRLVERYNIHLKPFGVELVSNPDAKGGFSNVRLLADKKVQAAFVHGGFAGALRDQNYLSDERIKRRGAEWNEAWPEKLEAFVSLGRLFYEPLWVFYLGTTDNNRLSSLEGQPVNVGSENTGTRTLATLLLDQNNVHFKPSLWLDEPLPELNGGEAKPLGESRAAFLQLPPDAPKVQGLLRSLAARRQKFDAGRAIKMAAFSPDGRRLVVVLGDMTARVWDATTGREMAILKGHTDEVNDASFSRDGHRVITASDDDTVRLWDAETGREVAKFADSSNDLNSVAFSPDGSRIVAASDDDTARVWDAASQQLLLVLRGHTDDVSTALFSPDGKRILTASKDTTARLWDVSTGRELTVLTGHEKEVMGAAFSPDGMRIATTSWDGTARLWDAASGRLQAVLKGHDGLVRTAAFSPDGRQLITASWDDTARVWDAATGVEVTVLKGHADDVNSAAFSADGTRGVTASKDGTVRLWDAKTWRELALFKAGEAAVGETQPPRRLQLMNFKDEADAYAIRFPFLSPVELPRGAIAFEPDIPAEPVTLLATSVALVVDKDWARANPSLVRVLTDAVVRNPRSGIDERTHKPILFHRSGQFPSLDDPEFQVSQLAVPIYKSGELPFLLSRAARMSTRIPFSVAAFLDEHGGTLILSLIPILTILVPLSRSIPALYTWTVRRRLLYWYRRLQALERRLDIEDRAKHAHASTPEIDRIDAAVSRIRVPLNFSDQYYDLRSHIDLVRQRLAARATASEESNAPALSH
jgi:DNA-binding beta-propeller fold protein YncE